jgi:hypothetical protein
MIVHAQLWSMGRCELPLRQPFYLRFVRLCATNGRQLSDISGLACGKARFRYAALKAANISDLRKRNETQHNI